MTHSDYRGVKVLTPKSIEVLRLSGKDFTTSQIARTLRISPRRVAEHRQKVCNMLGVPPGIWHRIKDAVIIARHEGLIS